MKEQNEIKTNDSVKVEEEIVRIIQKKTQGKQIPVAELEKMISEEIEKANYFSEDWQKHYVVERIKEKIKEEKYNFLPTTWGKRLSNLILDYITYFIIYLIVVQITEGFNELFISIIVTVSYYVIFESIWSKTPAKFITKTKVITEYGEKPNFKSIFIRTLIRFVPFEIFSFLGSGHPRGWHDRWSKTIVIDDILISKKAINPRQTISCCGECGKKINKHDRFCSECGAKI